MTYAEFTDQYRRHIQGLNFEKQFHLAISVSKKLFPDYLDFCLENNWGDPDCLLEGISYCETYFNNGGSPDKLREYAIRVFDNCPHSNDFDNASYAINASGAVHGTLEFLLDRNTNHIYEIGTYLTNNIDCKIHEDNEDISDDEIDTHSLMIDARRYLLS